MHVNAVVGARNFELVAHISSPKPCCALLSCWGPGFEELNSKRREAGWMGGDGWQQVPEGLDMSV